MRPRKKDRHLPPCVYVKHGAYWHVRAGKWTRLGADLPEALRQYAALAAPHTDSRIAGLLRLWLASIKVAPSTRKLYEQSAKRIANVFAEFEPHQIKPRDVAEWLAAESDKPAWANRLRNVLKLAMDKAVLLDMAERNPVVSVPRVEERERTRYITDGEYCAIYTNADPILRIVMRLAYFTSQRIGDILAIRHADLTQAGIAFDPQKTGARLMVEWTPELRQAVADARVLAGNVISPHLLTYRAKPWRYHTIWGRWQKACQAAGVADAHIHDLRAKSLTDATRQGIDAKALAGHTDQRMTDHYVKRRIVPVVKAPKFGTGF